MAITTKSERCCGLAPSPPFLNLGFKASAWIMGGVLSIIVDCSPASSEKLTTPSGSTNECIQPSAKGVEVLFAGKRTEGSAGESHLAGSITASNLQLPERPGTQVDEECTALQVTRNQKAKQALQDSVGQPVQKEISEADRQAIRGLVSQINGFAPASVGDSVQKLNRCVIAFVPGKMEGYNYNVYLIKVPGQSWMILEGRRMFDRERF